MTTATWSKSRATFLTTLASPVSRQSAWNTFGSKNVKLERNADKFEREFWAWLFWVPPGGLKPWRNNGLKNSRENFAVKIRWEFCRQFSNIRQTKIKKSPQIRSAEPRARTIPMARLTTLRTTCKSTDKTRATEITKITTITITITHQKHQ